MPTKQSDTSTLLSIIVNSAKFIENSYKSTKSKPYVPSLEELEPHPMDGELSSLQLKTATQTLEAACAQLCATLTRPNHNLTNKFMTIYLSACLNTILNAKIPDVIGTDQNGMAVEEIAKRTNIESRKLARVLRLLCTHHIFREVKPDVFANNRLSIQLQASNPLSDFGLHLSEECYPATGYLYETLSDPEWGPSYAANRSPFNKYTGFDEPLFTWYGGVGNSTGAEQGARFGRAMMGFNEAIEALSVVTAFPWGEMPRGATVNDVGGGIGHIIMELSKRYPHLKFKLQDLPERVEQAEKEMWPKECPETLKEGRIEFKGFDFLKESPITGCDIYYLKHIIHDWPDAESITILTNVRRAMGPNSRVLIHEYIIQTANRVPEGQSEFNQAPEPLLANYGAGRIRQYNLDLDMMNMLNAQERKLDDFVRLGKAAGLEFVKLWDFGEMNVVEFGVPKVV